ncbi:hypothetical protein [Vibrio phage CKB-S2]|nr:hypothetical protein [Vibrio phage CKB-S2]
MANSRFRCTGCKEYFPQSQKRQRNTGNFCSSACERSKQKKAQSKAFVKSKERRDTAPTVNQERDWLNQIQQFVINHGSFPKSARGKWQHHHLFGRKARHSGKEIGRWAVLPIEVKFHDVLSTNPNNITHFKKNYIESFGSDVTQFLMMCQTIEAEQGQLAIPQDILEAIAELA